MKFTIAALSMLIVCESLFFFVYRDIKNSVIEDCKNEKEKQNNTCHNTIKTITDRPTYSASVNHEYEIKKLKGSFDLNQDNKPTTNVKQK